MRIRHLTLTAALIAASLHPGPHPASAQTLPVRGPSSTSTQGSGVLLSDAIRAYVSFMRLPAVFIDPSVPRRSVDYVANGLDPQTAFSELLRSYGLTSIEDANGILHVGSTAVITTEFGGSPTRLAVRHGTPTATIPILQALTHDRVSFIADDPLHAIYAFGPAREIAQARAFLDHRDGSHSAVVRLKAGLSAVDLIDDLAPIASDVSGTMRALPERNAILLDGDDAYIAHMRTQIERLDRRPSQVFYTVSIIEISPKIESVQRGVQLGPVVAGRSAAGTGSTGTLISGVVPIGQISASLDALISQGRARILKRINVATISGTTAKAAYDNQIPILLTDPLTGIPTVRTVDAGVTLHITPVVGRTGLTTAIRTTYTEITGYASNGYPELAERTDESTITSNDGQSLLISGLYEDEDLNTWTQNPPFSYIPIIGGIFHHRSASAVHNEVVIVATPTIDTGTTSGPAFAFPVIPPALREHGIDPAPTPQPSPSPSTSP